MEPTVIRQISVWLDDSAPAGGAFAHALEWAALLGLPLRGAAEPGPRRPAAEPEAADALSECGAACAQRGVAWSGQPIPPTARGVDAFLGSDGLCVFGHALPAALKGQLLRRSLQHPRTAALVCPRSWERLKRVLILHQDGGPDSPFLGTAAALCRAFQAEPVVLTVARSEEEAQQRQEDARQALAAQRLVADFDFVVGVDVRTAILQAARWRRCPHAFVEKRSVAPWRRWLHGDPLGWLMGRSEWLTFLALPERAVLTRPIEPPRSETVPAGLPAR
jgi:hypothetical protein